MQLILTCTEKPSKLPEGGLRERIINIHIFQTITINQVLRVPF
ncbi:MAG: hypothetical protein ACYC25_07690 [Paludibacter sp.]